MGAVFWLDRPVYVVRSNARLPFTPLPPTLLSDTTYAVDLALKPTSSAEVR